MIERITLKMVYSSRGGVSNGSALFALVLNSARETWRFRLLYICNKYRRLIVAIFKTYLHFDHHRKKGYFPVRFQTCHSMRYLKVDFTESPNGVYKPAIILGLLILPGWIEQTHHLPLLVIWQIEKTVIILAYSAYKPLLFREPKPGF